MDPIESTSHEILDAVPDGIVIVDGEGRIRLVNQQTERLFGYARDELIGQPVEMLMAPELATTHRGHRARWGTNPHVRPMGQGLALSGRRRDGTDFPVEISLSPLGNDRPPHTIASVRDITERLRAEADLRTARDAVSMLEERERIARDLHDTVIQHLFAVGMSLQAVEAQITDASVKTRVQWAVDHLDETIREVRSVIFGLQSSRGPGGLRARIADLAVDSTRSLGFEPRLRFDGLVDAGVDQETGEQLLAALREALSNVARHARATRVDVVVEVGDETVTLRVVDDGVGIADGAVRGHGLANLEARAGALGGTCTIGPADGHGTRVEWRVPASGASEPADAATFPAS
jgi:two-component system, NarL family, sensor histidine kinase DevS